MPRIQAADFPAGNEIVTAFENINHLRDFERVILQVAIERRDELAAPWKNQGQEQPPYRS